MQANFLHLDAEYKYNQSHNETKENAAKKGPCDFCITQFWLCLYLFQTHCRNIRE